MPVEASPFVTLPAVGGGIVGCLMFGAWLRQRRTGNAGIVDLVWTVSLGALALLYALVGPGWPMRRALVAVLVGCWSLRLAWHLARRIGREPEDGRYRELRERLGGRAQSWFLGFFLLQGLLAVLLSLVFLRASSHPAAQWRALDTLAVSLFAAAQIGEALADAQLARWRAEPANRGRACRAGLWRYSRHPNYFFEWLHWIAYAFLAQGAPYGGLAWFAPLLMLGLVLRVTGIPPTERQALKSRPVDYARYQRTTSAFFPLPPRVDRDTTL